MMHVPRGDVQGSGSTPKLFLELVVVAALAPNHIIQISPGPSFRWRETCNTYAPSAYICEERSKVCILELWPRRTTFMTVEFGSEQVIRRQD